MAILKHMTSKNMSYFDALNYLQYKHKEDPVTGFYKPVLDEYGLYQERDNYALCCLDGYGVEQNPQDWPAACLRTNLTYGKNCKKEERKQHMYVISHPASDCPLLTKEILLEEGKAFVRDNLKGYDALIAVHMDTDHYHVHISLNSLRSAARQEEIWMMKDDQGNTLPCEMKAGCKHQDNPQHRRHCQQWLLEYTRSHGLTIEANLQTEDRRKQEKCSVKTEAIKSLLLETASRSASFAELKEKLQTEHEILLVRRGQTWSILLPGAKKCRRLKKLGLSESQLQEAMGITPADNTGAKQKISPEFEKKKYMEWLQHRRARNAVKAEDTIASAANLIAGRFREKGHDYIPFEFRELNDLLKQTVYLERDLQTELEKQSQLLKRWDQYRKADSDEKNRQGAYLRWCGCNPDSREEYDQLRLDLETASLQIREAAALREALIETAADWKDRGAKRFFHFRQSDTLSQKAQIQQQLKAVRTNRKKLEQIAFRCEEAAYRRIYKTEYLKKAACFREQWHKKLLQEDALKARLWEIREEERAGKRSAKCKK